jgi:hypothetical protein
MEQALQPPLRLISRLRVDGDRPRSGHYLVQ